MRGGLILAGLVFAGGCGRSGTPEAPELDVPFPRPIASGTSTLPTPTPTGLPFDFGNGTDGAQTFAAGANVVNQCDRILSATGLGASTADAFSIPLQQRVLLIQSQEEVAGASGATTDVSNAVVGHFELARVESYSSIGDGIVGFTEPLVNDYSTNAGRSAQICTVPEYETLTLSGMATIEPATPFNETTTRNGVVALFVNGTLTMGATNAIHADGFGFAGGARSDAGGNSVATDDTALDDGGEKGLSIERQAPPCCGRGSIANGAGGGNGKSAGGGGGGNAGRGGLGGSELEGGPADAQGRGGGAVLVTGTSLRAVFGGGGGGGHNETAGNAGAGGNGGGVVIVFARVLNGNGRISANGADGGNTTGTTGGGGGGGAGGTLIVVTESGTYVGGFGAFGGAGGDVVGSAMGSRRGPGGGGGGGRIYMRGFPPPAAAAVAGGSVGVNLDAGNSAFNALPGAPGVVIDLAE